MEGSMNPIIQTDSRLIADKFNQFEKKTYLNCKGTSKDSHLREMPFEIDTPLIYRNNFGVYICNKKKAVSF